MTILIACEESQAVTIEFRKRGFDAYSCDILPCSGGHPEWHIQGDVLKQLNKGWDCMIAFPPCTHLAVSGAAWFEQKRKDGRQKEAIEFFMQILNAPIKYKAVENPIGIISGGDYIKTHFPDLATKYNLPVPYNQVIHPYYFGDPHEKSTCLWLQNLPLLFHAKSQDLFNTEITHIKPEERFEWIDKKTGKTKSQPKWYAESFLKKGIKNIGYERSKTFPGIANAMATQWGDYLLTLKKHT
jgi:site-specific DNA-cytosine methylase